MKNKVDYGIDAPEIIRNRIIGGIVLAIIAIGVSIYFRDSIDAVRIFLVSVFSLLSGVFIISAIMMIISSKFGKKKEAERIIELLNIKGDEFVLDVGCGRGLYLIGIAKKLNKGKAVGIDIWSKDLSKNSKKNTLQNVKSEKVTKKVDIRTADMSKIPIKDNTFDLVISSFAINNILDKAKRRKALTEIIRVLKTQGKICIIDMRNIDEYVAVFEECGIEDIQILNTKYLYPRSKIILGIKNNNE
ncbi:MAG: class I SAM-dependent methyltransferase [Peptostreptococcaceae bacterium]